VKSEIERINAQTVTKEEMKALNKTVKKHLEDNPEDAQEPKGKRGRPKSVQTKGGASSSSQAPASGAASSSQIQMDTTQSKSYWMQKHKSYILEQMEVRGFDNAKHWDDIKKATKPELMKMVKALIDKEKR